VKPRGLDAVIINVPEEDLPRTRGLLRKEPGYKRKREPGRRGGPGSLRRRKDVLSKCIVAYKSRNEKRFKAVPKNFLLFYHCLDFINIPNKFDSMKTRSYPSHSTTSFIG